MHRLLSQPTLRSDCRPPIPPSAMPTLGSSYPSASDGSSPTEDATWSCSSQFFPCPHSPNPPSLPHFPPLNPQRERLLGFLKPRPPSIPIPPLTSRQCPPPPLPLSPWPQDSIRSN
ncbi:hypothetical protein IE53DRAFT_90242 [Violaceomyces palustris]|uniref:Uncharacterized protein n=1 Tax=Violaceomyces palustris TaxID=1673888 RepID=A0ACD0P7C2_9BASI|nr:hypothetical protein IE53DRAFT_90242 [Violaceomyces palustris]